MSKVAQQQTHAGMLERIQSLMAELRQTEALSAQIHEMVTMKRQRLESLMSEFVEIAKGGEVVVEPPVAAPVVEDLPMSSHGSYGAPKDLLQGRPAPSAQHVLDSLNRLMVGIKDITAKQAAA